MESDKPTKTITEALYWAFMVELAQVELPDLRPPEERGFGFGTEYVLIERMRLGGVQIDTSKGRSSPHEDAEVIAGSVGKLVKLRHGRALAISIALFGRTGIVPDWMPGAVPRIQPVEWGKRNHLGRFAKTQILRTWHQWYTVPHPKNPKHSIRRKAKIVEEWCPCTWSPSLQQIESARAGYVEWWRALDMVRIDVKSMGLRKFDIIDAMPPRRPWLKRQVAETRTATIP